jgi:hypothetical protein
MYRVGTPDQRFRVKIVFFLSNLNKAHVVELILTFDAVTN